MTQVAGRSGCGEWGDSWLGDQVVEDGVTQVAGRSGCGG